ncbi:MAG: GMC family oxidoreductase [Rubrimonas sp.]
MAETFDYVIVGGGTAGCVLANRLSADPRRTVLLIEAGGEPSGFWIPIPAGFSRLLTSDRWNWRFATEPEPATHDRVIAVPRGRGLGGSTLINGMIWVQGQPQDYDGWAQRGCPGWGWADVAPVFRAIEDFAGPESDARGRGGPVPVVSVAERPALARAFIAAGRAAGHPENPDYNGATQDGFGWYQVNQRRGRRVSAYDAYLKPARNRPNLSVRTGVHALRVDLRGARAVGVTARVDGAPIAFRARAEVILTAGAIQTPQLLELSGIGDPAVLAAAGVPVLHAAPGVGTNYVDHFCTRMNWRVTRPVTLNEQTRGWRLALAVARYALRRDGILSLGTGLAHGFVRTRPGLDGPDAQFFFMHASYANAAERKLDRQPGMTVGVTQLRPQSRGTIHIRSRDPGQGPAIRPNFLDAEEDRRCMVEAMKIARHVVAQPPMDPWRGQELSPGPACGDDAAWLDFARANGQTIYHAAGTVRMGADPDAPLDARLRFRGIEGLRVADASVMPTMVSGNTQAAVFMVAEKAAAMILQDAR